MPIHTHSLDRRSFLAQGAAVVGSLTVLRSGWASSGGTDPHRFALLADTHIPHLPEVEARGTNMTANLRQVVGEILATSARPSGVLLNGDCAYSRGLPEDYANLAAAIAPLDEARVPLHVTMGNHDDREPLYHALTNQQAATPVLESKHVAILESPHANWFLLDSLTEVNVVTGEIGEVQREWLASALAARPDKPALVMAHHTPQFEAPPEGTPWSGLKDTAEFMELLEGFPQVKAFIFGHSHNWSVSRRGNLHLINLPPVGYVFSAEKPNGWILATTREDGLDLELHTIDPNHPSSRERTSLRWA